MKRFTMFLMALAILSVAACKSKEEKAAELIKQEMFKTLYDFESYQPVETKVSEAKANVYNDTSLWRRGKQMSGILEEMDKHMTAANNALDHMSIWGAPSYYSSSYSDRKYYHYKSQAAEDYSKAMEAYGRLKHLMQESEDMLAEMDTTQVIGWEVRHTFRCKTRGGLQEIEHYRYLMDPSFKRIILCEDEEDDALVRSLLSQIATGEWREQFQEWEE